MSSKRGSKKSKYVELTLDMVRDIFKQTEKVIEYYYVDGGNPNKMTKKELENRKYYFVPTGTLIIKEFDKTMTTVKTKRVIGFLNRNNNHIIDYSKKPGRVFYYLEVFHKFSENEKLFLSQVQICHGNIISDNCIGGANWIRNN